LAVSATNLKCYTFDSCRTPIGSITNPHQGVLHDTASPGVAIIRLRKQEPVYTRASFRKLINHENTCEDRQALVSGHELLQRLVALTTSLPKRCRCGMRRDTLQATGKPHTTDFLMSKTLTSPFTAVTREQLVQLMTTKETLRRNFKVTKNVIYRGRIERTAKLNFQSPRKTDLRVRSDLHPEQRHPGLAAWCVI